MHLSCCGDAVGSLCWSGPGWDVGVEMRKLSDSGYIFKPKGFAGGLDLRCGI